jgi:uncharacterized integral membrane protein
MSAGPGASSDGRKLGAGAIASLTGVGLLIIFMIQNTDDVRLDFLIWHFTWPLWLLTITSAVVGAVVWFGLGVVRRHRRRRERRRNRRS